jgi:UDP-GlcNAc3NAcA epimerase
MLYLINNSDIVITDSGGLQKDAFFSKKYCITLRNETEWVELINFNFNKLFNKNINKTLFEIYSEIKQNNADFKLNLYGNGQASEKIINYLVNF